jgi:hypothetical protein
MVSQKAVLLSQKELPPLIAPQKSQNDVLANLPNGIFDVPLHTLRMIG